MENFIPKNFEDLACYWILIHGSTHKAASSLKRDQGILRNYLFPAFAESSLDDLSIRKVDQWFASLCQLDHLSAKSCNDILGLLKKILNDGERWGFIKDNPSRLIKKKKIEEQSFDYWSLDEARQYIGYWSLQEEKPRIFWPIVVSLYTGMRRGELIGLHWSCVNSEQGLITVKRSYCRIEGRVKEETKSKKIRYIPICKALANQLAKLKAMTSSSGFVCPIIPPDRYHIEFKSTVRTAGLKSIRFHDLRHTFASHFMIGGGNIYDLQKILGHSSVQVTERYAHLCPESLKNKTEVLEY